MSEAAIEETAQETRRIGFNVTDEDIATAGADGVSPIQVSLERLGYEDVEVNGVILWARISQGLDHVALTEAAMEFEHCVAAGRKLTPGRLYLEVSNAWPEPRHEEPIADWKLEGKIRDRESGMKSISEADLDMRYKCPHCTEDFESARKKGQHARYCPKNPNGAKRKGAAPAKNTRGAGRKRREASDPELLAASTDGISYGDGHVDNAILELETEKSILMKRLARIDAAIVNLKEI
jgi:hypothetical protein